MAPPQKRKTGVFGMGDLKNLTNKRQKTGVSAMVGSNKSALHQRKTGIFGMSDLKKNTKEARAKGRTGSRRLQDLAANELSTDDALMDDLTLDHTLGVSSDVSADEEDNDQDSDESHDSDVSEAEESSSEGEDAEGEGSDVSSSVPEEDVSAGVKGDPKHGTTRKNTLRGLNQFLDRVEADNQLVAKMTDEELSTFAAKEDEGGFYDLVPVADDEKVPESELVESASFEEIKPGVWYDATTNQLYRPTNLTDPETKKIRKTVRRHKKGPPEGQTFKVSKISASELKKLKAKTEEGDFEDEAEKEGLAEEEEAPA
ncbi:hypothetical protein A1O7_07463 [Cladophialophora yegresii CBS 114405]|uniref:Uncharacterized protein n=1 Tax=Cladophialophora yegresii CBS 114405 TaxID=1182544 RepID=W9WF17_9EURO|nr:uncharacterized protein A1O7_07463 [Cladophialophora yegresii CBS 114405]EXJ57119.1 hypothetical protein A1O7_07463 [Cladophialophora yegresii CBS 114405]